MGIERMQDELLKDQKSLVSRVDGTCNKNGFTGIKNDVRLSWG